MVVITKEMVLQFLWLSQTLSARERVIMKDAFGQYFILDEMVGWDIESLFLNLTFWSFNFLLHISFIKMLPYSNQIAAVLF